MPDRDVSFTFDTKQFENGIKTLNKGMKGMETTATKVAKGVAAGMVVATAAIGVFKLGIKGARKLLNEMLSGMPEIGQAFKIMKDIFFRNFLYPIRKAIMPFLQRMLDWVRDHRALFVKWGHVVVGIFRTIIQIGRRVIDMFRRIWQGAARILSNVFGVEIKRVGDLMNIMAFKISATIQFLTVLLTPLFRKIGEIAEKIAGFGVNLIKNFFQGFSEGAPGAFTQIKNVLDVVKDLIQAIVDIDKETGAFSTTLRVLGTIVGGVLMQALLIVEGAIHGIIFGLRALVPTFAIIGEKLKPKAKRDLELIEEHKKRLRDLAEVEEGYFKGLFQRQKEALQKTGGAILETIEVNPWFQEKKARQEGRALEVDPMVKEKKASRGQAPTTNIEMGGVNIVVPEGTEESQAKRVVNKVVEILQFRWNKEQETLGY